MNWISKLEALRAAGTPVVAVTVTGTTGSVPREIGAKMLVLEDGSLFGTIGGGNLEFLAIEEAKQRLSQKTSGVVKYPLGAKTGQCCGGSVDLFFEVLNDGPQLYLFGAGHVGQALARTLNDTRFHVHLIDERREWVLESSVPPSVSRHCCEWENFVDEATWSAEKTYVAIMTHRHDLDEAILGDVLKRETRYVGLIGSDTKWNRFKHRLTGKNFSPVSLEKVHCPIGLFRAGKQPQEIAVSVAAELLQSLHE